MSITTGRSPIVMDAAGDDLSSVFQGRDMNLPTPGVVRLKLNQITYVAGASGPCVLKSGSGITATEIYRSPSLDPGESDTTAFGQTYWTDNVYVALLPAGGRVYLYYE